jgi:hypothetical protein
MANSSNDPSGEELGPGAIQEKLMDPHARDGLCGSETGSGARTGARFIRRTQTWGQ